MPNDDVMRIRFIVDDAQAKTGLQNVRQGLNETKKAADNAEVGMANLFRGQGIAGVRMRDFRNTLGGVAMGLDAVSGSAGKAGDAMVTAARGATGLLTNLAYMGPIGLALTGISLVVGHFVEQQRAADAAIKAAMESSDKLAESLDALNKPVGGLARALYDELGITKDVAEAWSNAAQESDSFAGKLRALAKVSREATQAELDYAKAVQGLQMAQYLTPANEEEVVSLNAWGAAAEEAKWKAYDLYWQKKLLLETTVELTSTTSDYSFALDDMSTSLHLADEWTKKLKADSDALETSLLAAATKVANYMKQAVASAVGAVIKPTSVTAADIAALDQYIDKWDELARQSDIIARDGEARLAEFPKLDAALEKTRLSAAQFGEQFRSGALFADIKPEELLGGVGGGIEKLAVDAMQKLKETIGQKHLSDAVSKEVWAKMPDAMEKELKAMGIETLSDADKIPIDVRKHKDFDKNLGSIVDAILDSMPITVTFDWTKPSDNKSNDTGSSAGGGGNLWQPPIYVSEDYGGTGVLSKPTLFMGHPGERYWFSGTHNEVPPPAQSIVVNANVSNQIDIERMAYRLAREMQRHK